MVTTADRINQAKALRNVLLLAADTLGDSRAEAVMVPTEHLVEILREAAAMYAFLDDAGGEGADQAARAALTDPAVQVANLIVDGVLL